MITMEIILGKINGREKQDKIEYFIELTLL
jgi:hypothetical protein